MALIILVSILILLILVLLFLPIQIRIDTENKVYRAGIPQLSEIIIVPDAKEIFRIRLKIFFISWYVSPFRLKDTSQRFKLRTYKKPAKKGISIRRATPMLRAIKVKKLALVFDTGNPVLNAQIIPICQSLHGENSYVAPNFNGINYLILHLETRIFNIIQQILITKN